MKRGINALSATALAVSTLVGCRTADVESDVVLPAPPGAAPAVVPAGTMLNVDLDQTLTADGTEVGERFTATVDEAVTTSGVTVPKGTKVTGVVTGIDDSDRLGDQGAIRLAFESIELDGQPHAFSAEVTDADVDITDVARVGDVTEKAGIGGATGAVLGAIIGGSLKDILVGGVLGAGAGTILSLGLGDVESALPKGTDLTLRTTSRVARGNG